VFDGMIESLRHVEGSDHGLIRGQARSGAKGCLRAEDARRFVDGRCRRIISCEPRGRVLASVPAAVTRLAARGGQLVGQDVPRLSDGGIRAAAMCSSTGAWGEAGLLVGRHVIGMG